MSKPAVGVAIIGTGFAARVHASALRAVTAAYRLSVNPVLTIVAGRRPPNDPVWDAPEFQGARQAFSTQEAVDTDEVQLVIVCTPDTVHAEVVRAALESRKHVLCEKPLAHSGAEARQLAVIARDADRVAAVGFNYRRLPAVGLGKQMIAAGAIGVPKRVHARFMQESGLSGPIGWRGSATYAPAGVLADLGSHVIDLAQHLTGMDVTDVSAHIDDRESEVPESAAVIVRMGSGCVHGILELSRRRWGAAADLSIEVSGTEGTLNFQLSQMNRLRLALRGDPGFRDIAATRASDPWIRWPDGHAIGWENSFVYQLGDLLLALEAGHRFEPDFDTGARVQTVVDALVTSHREEHWSQVGLPR